MSGDENKLKKYRFPETLTNQSRWFGLPLDELIPAAICIGWGTGPCKPHSASGPDVDVPGRARGISTVCPGVGAESVPPCVYPAVGH